MHEEEITFDQAYLSYFRVICLYIMSRLPCDRYTAEDIAAETFLTLQLKWNTVSPHHRGVIAVWLHRTADNKIRDHQKKQARTPIVMDAELLSAQELRARAEEFAEIDREIDFQKLSDRICRALSGQDRALFRAIYLEEQTTEELMKRFGISASTLYLRRSRLKRKLQKILSKKADKP